MEKFKKVLVAIIGIISGIVVPIAFVAWGIIKFFILLITWQSFDNLKKDFRKKL